MNNDVRSNPIYSHQRRHTNSKVVNLYKNIYITMKNTKGSYSVKKKRCQQNHLKNMQGFLKFIVLLLYIINEVGILVTISYLLSTGS